MSDPLNPWEQKDRLEPSGDLSPEVEGLTGIMNTVGGGLHPGVASGSDAAGTEHDAEEARRAAAGGVGDPDAGSGADRAVDVNRDVDPDRDPGAVDTDSAADANDLEADNAVEQETVETVDPRNAPA
jgi:hypothetical protein